MHFSDNTAVIVGAGHAGVIAATSLRRHGWEGRIVLIDDQAHLPYERPPLSKEHLKPDASNEATLMRKESFYAEKGIELIRGVQVLQLDPSGKRILLGDGSHVSYSKLVLATGASPRALTLPGADVAGVLQLKTLDDAHLLKSALHAGGRVVVIGAGYIGLETAAAATKYSCQVTVVEAAPRIMNRTTSDVVASHYQRLHMEHGVTFKFGATVQQIEGQSRVTGVVTDDGERIPADVVLVGIGVIPNQALAEAAGISCRDGILVDEAGETSDPDVYAIGDVTRFASLFDGASQRLECIANAQEQAERTARALTGKEQLPREVPWFWTVQYGVRLQTAGVRDRDDEVLVRGNPESDQFTVCYLRDGRLAAVDAVGSLKDFRSAKKLIAAHAVVIPEIARDVTVPLGDSAALQTI